MLLKYYYYYITVTKLLPPLPCCMTFYACLKISPPAGFHTPWAITRHNPWASSWKFHHPWDFTLRELQDWQVGRNGTSSVGNQQEGRAWKQLVLNGKLT